MNIYLLHVDLLDVVNLPFHARVITFLMRFSALNRNKLKF